MQWPVNKGLENKGQTKWRETGRGGIKGESGGREMEGNVGWGWRGLGFICKYVWAVTNQSSKANYQDINFGFET